MTAALAFFDNAPSAPVAIYNRLLRLDQVKEMVGLGKTMIYRLVKEGAFPAPLKPGGNATRWSENDVLSWIAACSAGRVN